MNTRFARVNGIKIAYRVQGEGPPLVLVMGYRLSSVAWPASLIESLTGQFTVITLDNRGTGQSDKPLEGYAVANMARDVCGVLDELEMRRVYMLGYSMGGAIAQEFVRQFPERVSGLVLCASMSGGSRASYASPSVLHVMRDLDGLSPEQAARRIWKVTYSPRYLERHQAVAEDQMRREIALPTPLHAADLQFQALAEFDGSRALAQVCCPTLILTGDLDELIPPQNSVMMAKHIPGAELVIMPGYGHRVLWEATKECAGLITNFVAGIHGRAVAERRAQDRPDVEATAVEPLMSAVDFFFWPIALARAGFEFLELARHATIVGNASLFGDGKPLILVSHFLGSELALLPLSIWLKALGYRPLVAGLVVTDSSGEQTLSQTIRDVTRRLGRKTVLITHSSGMTRALRTADAHKQLISDVIIFEAPYEPEIDGVRTHFIASGWPHSMTELARLLRGIGIELLETPRS